MGSQGFSQTVVFYVSGHGYGHAVRMAHVIRRLRELDPGRRVAVRTEAPGWLFPSGVDVRAAEFDSGAVERCAALRIDARATGGRLRALIRNRAEIAAREAAFLCMERAALVVADVPFLAGEAAAAAGVPCIAIGNFTWDWIYEPLLDGGQDSPELLGAVREGYGKMARFLRLPFGQTEGFEIFPRVTDVPLVASVSRRETSEILRDLGLIQDGRKRILIGMRGGVPRSILDRAAAAFPEVHFLEPGAVEFADLVKVSDAVISKLGYGIAAACAAHATPLLYPPRHGFREDGVLEQQLRRCIPMRPITEERFLNGDWKSDLEALAGMEPSERQVPCDGDLVCAQLIRKTLNES